MFFPVFKGMNFIAGYLLIITKDEEKSFWLMDALLGRILPGQSVFLSFKPIKELLKVDKNVFLT